MAARRHYKRAWSIKDVGFIFALGLFSCMRTRTSMHIRTRVNTHTHTPLILPPTPHLMQSHRA